MIYADYDYYSNDYHGSKLTADNYSYYAGKASKYIDLLTFGRASTYDDATGAIKSACCALAEIYAAHDNSYGKTSERVGDLSVTYAALNDRARELKSVIVAYLAHTGLLFAGDEHD